MAGIVRQGAVALALVGTLVMNTLANTLPLAGRGTGEISAMFPIPFTPAGWVFSIWGVIYLGLTVFTIYQALPAQRNVRVLDRIGWLFVVSCAFNVGWLVAWHNVAIGLTLPLMLGLFASLLAVYGIIRSHQRSGAGTAAGFGWAVRVPFSIYLGWITVATVANVSIFLYDVGWQPGRETAVAWSFVLVLVAAAIGLWVLTRNRDVVYAAVLVWAFAGIAAKEWEASLLATGAIVAAGILALLALRAALRRADGGGAARAGS